MITKQFLGMAMALLCLALTACNKDAVISEAYLNENAVAIAPKVGGTSILPGHDFRQVGFLYEKEKDGFQLVNKVPGVQNIHENIAGYRGEHWVCCCR